MQRNFVQALYVCEVRGDNSGLLIDWPDPHDQGINFLLYYYQIYLLFWIWNKAPTYIVAGDLCGLQEN